MIANVLQLNLDKTQDLLVLVSMPRERNLDEKYVNTLWILNLNSFYFIYQKHKKIFSNLCI